MLVPVIAPHAIYNLVQAQAVLRHVPSCLPREIRLGRLRVTKRAGRYFILGEWLMQWLRDGELRRTAELNGCIGGAAEHCQRRGDLPAPSALV